jgi:hypothetical protein
MKKSTLIFLIVLFSVVYLGGFGLLFSTDVMTDDTSFVFQVVTAIMSTGLLAIITFFMFTVQSQMESQRENRAKIFEKKIEFYNVAVDQLDEIFLNGTGDKTNHQLLFLVSKAMLVASPNAADKFSKLFLAFQNQDGIPDCFHDFIVAAREDLDLVDRISDGTADSFNPILSRLEQSIKTETRKIRFWSDEQKIQILEDYAKQKTGKGKWLKEKHGLHFSQIATWKKQLLSDE